MLRSLPASTCYANRGDVCLIVIDFERLAAASDRGFHAVMFQARRRLWRRNDTSDAVHERCQHCRYKSARMLNASGSHLGAIST